MANSNSGGHHGSYDSSLPTTSGPAIPPIDPTLRDANIPGPDPTIGANFPIPAPALTLDETVGSTILSPLFCEQLRQFIIKTINSTFRGSQASRAGPSFQLERGGTPGSQGMD
ncbi:UNVERIFIED_CONTAM: hypothetical protein Sradi_5838500 [Sesamum radiatum]|uniref:Uncharacterized protein n=1 Tax=Sesamum radiatum TaxID=300843 RepID=A0AAW2KSY6_SESRA